MTDYNGKIICKKFSTITKFCKTCLHLKKFVIFNLLRKFDLRKLMFWKSFGIYEKVSFWRMLLFIFGITKPLFPAFFRKHILILSAIYNLTFNIRLAKNSKTIGLHKEMFPKCHFFRHLKISTCKN